MGAGPSAIREEPMKLQAAAFMPIKAEVKEIIPAEMKAAAKAQEEKRAAENVKRLEELQKKLGM
jgi:hypothetical protein